MTKKIHLAEIVAKARECGLQVYMRASDSTYMIFTDGTRLGYLQAERFGGYSLTSVHVANRTTGTGFKMTDSALELESFNRETFERAFAHSPEWAYREQRESVKKYRDIEHYRQGHFNAAYVPYETRYCRASVRQEGAQGVYETRVFACLIPINGSHDETNLNLIRSIRDQGFETQRIIEHSAKRDCV